VQFWLIIAQIWLPWQLPWLPGKLGSLFEFTNPLNPAILAKNSLISCTELKFSPFSLFVYIAVVYHLVFDRRKQ